MDTREASDILLDVVDDLVDAIQIAYSKPAEGILNELAAEAYAQVARELGYGEMRTAWKSWDTAVRDLDKEMGL